MIAGCAGLGLLASAACAAACVAGACAATAVQGRRERAERRRRAGASAGLDASGQVECSAAGGLAARVLAYATQLSRRIAHGLARPVVPAAPRNGHVRAGGSGGEGRVCWPTEHVQRAGRAATSISWQGYREAKARLLAGGSAVGALAGAVLSNELAVLGGLAGAVAGFAALPWAIRNEERARAQALARELPEMLEVVALGLRSGLTFDRSFGLYHGHFDTAFARACASAQRQWALGLKPRDQALRDLAATYDSPLLSRVAESAIRSLRFGSSLAANFEAAAAEARAVYRAQREEQVAKAPVKMMVPTGTLILPAMLILVLGPILLELMEGF